LAESDPAKARAAVEAMCEKLLANTVIENYAIELNG
ncbi:MAG TPA: phosphoribosylformylglycinamidine synthase subunit PurS, partial [Kiloniellaceae bacterium]